MSGASMKIPRLRAARSSLHSARNDNPPFTPKFLKRLPCIGTANAYEAPTPFCYTPLLGGLYLPMSDDIQLHGAKPANLYIDHDRLMDCIHCGLCLSQCP